MEDQPPRDLAKELREAIAKSPVIMLRVWNRGTETDPIPELLVLVRATGELQYITQDGVGED